MNLRRTVPSRAALAALSLLVVAAGCSDAGSPTEPDPVLAVIELTPGAGSMTRVGATLRFSAAGFATNNDPMPGLTFSWQSSDPAVATIASDGTATARGFGSTTISASSGSITGSATLVVRDCSQPLSLAVGAWVALPLPSGDACGVILPSGDEGDRYRVGVVRTDGTTCSDLQPNCGIAGIDDIEVTVTALGAVAGAPRPAAAPPALLAAPSRRWPAPEHLLEAARMAERTARLHEDLHADARSLFARLGSDAVLTAPVRAQGAGPVRTEMPARLELDNSTQSSCTAGSRVVALKIWEDERLAFYQDSVQALDATLRVDAPYVERMAAFYRDFGEDVITDYFGGISDIDGNGKVVVFISPMVRSGVAAFVWSGDFFSRSSCAASNQGEYIYFSAPLIRNQDGGNWQSLETLVHEMKHVSSLKKSIDRGDTWGDPYHPSWVEEGTAEIAGNVATRRAWASVGGPAPNVRIEEEAIRDTGFEGDDLRPEFYGMAIRLIRTQGYLSSQPNGVTINPLGASTNHSIYGSGYHFHRWLGDAFGDAASASGADAELFRDQNASTVAPGLAGLQALTGRPFRELMVDYAAATMLNDDRFGLGVPTGGISTVDFASSIELFCFSLSPSEWQALRDANPSGSPPCGYTVSSEARGPTGSYPWPVTAQPDGRNAVAFGNHTFNGQIGNGGLRIHDFVSTGSGDGIEVRVSADRQPTATRVVVVRVR